MAGFHSYIMLLHKYLYLIKPRFILEWGPGESTKEMVKICPNADIYTIEHDPHWFNEWRNHFIQNSRVHIYHIHRDKDYATRPLQWGRIFDLVFVDGYCDLRVACLRVTQSVLRPRGVVILHDSERHKYRAGIQLFQKLEEAHGTCVMKQKTS